MAENILVADIGGTNARFGIASRDKIGAWQIDSFAKLPGASFATFNEALTAYTKEKNITLPENAIFSVAGPVKDDRVELTNRDWFLDARDLKSEFGFHSCFIVNDFAAMTRAVPELPQEELRQVKTGKVNKDAPILVAGPGTGFGVGYLVPVGQGRWHVMTTEGGHVAYAPQTARELDILKILQAKKNDFISLENISSGSGLDDVHWAVCERHGLAYAPLSPDEIRARANELDPVCREVCEIRAAATMGALGDLALAGGATGGVVMAGGVSERMIDWMLTENAMQRFTNRGSHTDYMDDIPIYLMTHPEAALFGAAALYEDLIVKSS